MSNSAVWTGEGHGLLHASFAQEHGLRQHLVVERLPGAAGWDWVAWRADQPSRPSNGREKTQEAAMLAAERAVLRLAGRSYEAQYLKK